MLGDRRPKGTPLSWSSPQGAWVPNLDNVLATKRFTPRDGSSTNAVTDQSGAPLPRFSSAAQLPQQ